LGVQIGLQFILSELKAFESGAETSTSKLLTGKYYRAIKAKFLGNRAESKIAQMLAKEEGVNMVGADGKAVTATMRTIEGAGVKAVDHSAERAGIQAASKIGLETATAAETGPAAPFVEAAEFAFNMFTGFMDELNLGGFQDMTGVDAMNSMRDEIWSTVVDAAKNANCSDTQEACENEMGSPCEEPGSTSPSPGTGSSPAPRCVQNAAICPTSWSCPAQKPNVFPATYGPLDIVDEDTLTTVTIERMKFLLPGIIQDIITSMWSLTPLIDPSTPAFTDYIMNQMDSKIDDLLNEIYSEICTVNNGLMSSTGECSFTKENCVARWPMQADDTYYEWSDASNRCETRPSAMRLKCDRIGMGVQYDANINSCKMSDEYCRRYGADEGVGPDGNCKFSEAENLAETILGTAFVRGIVNVMDFEHNYKDCPPGSHIPYELIAVSGAGMAVGANMLCATNSCPDGQDRMGEAGTTGGLCYDNCPAGTDIHDPNGYRHNWDISDGSADLTAVMGMCYQNCPAWANRSTTEQCIRDMVVKIPAHTDAVCPSDYDTIISGSGGLCQPSCNDAGFTKKYGGICYNDHVDTNLLIKIPNKNACPNGQRDDGTSCWEDFSCSTHCDSNWNWNDGGFCHTNCGGCGCIKTNLFDRQYCDTGYDLIAGMCYAQSRPLKITRPMADVGQCPPNYHKPDGLGTCYQNCETFGGSYYESTPGFCQMDYMAAYRDSYAREPNGSAYKVFPRERTVPYPTTSQDDFKNSTLGSHMQQGINAARNGDAGGVFRAAAAASIVSDPFVVGLGAGQLANLGACQVDNTCDAQNVDGTRD